jgi:uroporphyrinogen decarboxylase
MHPLASMTRAAQIADYPLPDVSAPGCWSHLAGEVTALHRRQRASMGELACTVFEQSWYLRGLENLLTDMVMRPEMAEVLLDRMTQLRCVQARTLAQAGVDILRLGDDVSTQRGMLMSVSMWRQWLKARLAAVISAARAVKPDILVFYHSDGDCRAIVPELIEIGVDILNPVQPECMDPAEMKRLYGDRLAFWGTMGTQTTFPFGTPDEVRRVVRERIRTVGAGGGLLLAPTHILEPDVPWENIVAFFEAIDEQGVHA